MKHVSIAHSLRYEGCLFCVSAANGQQPERPAKSLIVVVCSRTD
jgi:hypothetical protein